MTTERQLVESLAGITVDDIQRAWKFYKNEVYDDGYKSRYNLFTDTKEIFNPVPKIAFIMNALTVQKNLEIEIIEGDQKAKKEEAQNTDTEDTKKETIEAIWEYNSFQKMKYLLILWMILSKRAIIELSRKTKLGTEEKVIVITLHDLENVEEIKKVGNEIVYARLKGESEKFNKETREFETISVTKEYYNIEGYNALIESYSGTSTNSDELEENSTKEGAKINEDGNIVIPLTWGFIPIIEFDTDYDITPLFNKIDSYNQIEAYLDNIFYLHGDPLIWDTNAETTISKDDAKAVKESRFKQQAWMHLGPDAKMQYLEMQGNVAKLMLEKQDKLLEIIENDYPEYVLASILSKGDPSGDALEIKATEIIAKVESLRGDVENGIVKMDNMALQMLGSTPVDHKLKFAEILPKSLKELVDLLKSLREIMMLTKKTFMKKLPEIYSDPDEEIKNLKKEEKEIVDQIRQDLAGDHDADTED